jgi:hypothetical protein
MRYPELAKLALADSEIYIVPKMLSTITVLALVIAAQGAPAPIPGIEAIGESSFSVPAVQYVSFKHISPNSESSYVLTYLNFLSSKY